MLREKRQIELAVENFEKLVTDFEDQKTLLELAEEESDETILKEAEGAIQQLQKRAKQQEIEGLFSGEADANDCFIEINAGAGGTESCDWAAMLLRMYLRWAELHSYKTQLIDENPGEEAGTKSATIRVSGLYAYGWAKAESGVHRLVRISPFDSAARRHTSFASVWVYPVVDESIEIEILDKDLKVDTYRASGAGGQHVNKTESAIRITHIPTGIIVACQNDRSQHRNRAEAMNMLKARMYEMELRKKEAAANAANAQKSDNSWGSQIRSYVLHPYQMVKDARTAHETGNSAAVLDGDLDAFMSAYLVQSATKGAGS